MAASIETSKPPAWFWVAAVLALLWELAGLGAFLSQWTMDAADVAAYPEAQRQIYAATPPWVNGAFAVAVFGGTAGAIGLLLRRKWSKLLFIVSLVAAVLQFGWVFAVARAHVVIGPSAAGFPAFIIAVGALLIWFSGSSAKRGWLS